MQAQTVGLGDWQDWPEGHGPPQTLAELKPQEPASGLTHAQMVGLGELHVCPSGHVPEQTPASENPQVMVGGGLGGVGGQPSRTATDTPTMTPTIFFSMAPLLEGILPRSAPQAVKAWDILFP
jgi:hypothetical protein